MMGGSLLQSIAALWHRELVRFYRQRSRVIGALGTPFIFWFLIGSGFGKTFGEMGSNDSYLSFFAPGIIFLILLFTTIFSTFSLIQDRQEGFLQGVIVAPVPRLAIVLGKVLGGVTIAMIQSALFLVIMIPLQVSWNFSGWYLVLAILFFNALILSAFGFFMAWKVNSIQGFHVVMNMALMPMWFLSGALFPIEEAPKWMAWIMQLNPLSHGLALVRNVFWGDDLFTTETMPHFIYLIIVGTFLFGLCMKSVRDMRVKAS